MFVRVSSSAATTPRGAKAGVIGFNVWMTAVDREFQIAIDRYRGADGIVIDLRGNPGGLAGMIMGLSGHFLAERATLGVMTTRQQAQPLRFHANPRLVNGQGARVEPYAGPVAILVDGLTGSASECFTGGMQSLGRTEVGAVQRVVRSEDADQRQAGEVVALHHHLRSDQDVEFAIKDRL